MDCRGRITTNGLKASNGVSKNLAVYTDDGKHLSRLVGCSVGLVDKEWFFSTNDGTNDIGVSGRTMMNSHVDLNAFERLEGRKRNTSRIAGFFVIVVIGAQEYNRIL